MGKKTLVPNVIYRNGFSPFDIPRIFKSKTVRKQVQISKGVRSCSKSKSADKAALKFLIGFEARSRRYHPSLKVARIGWEEGRHYWDNKGGGFGTSGRSCTGHILTTFYVDFTKQKPRKLASPTNPLVKNLGIVFFS